MITTIACGRFSLLSRFGLFYPLCRRPLDGPLLFGRRSQSYRDHNNNNNANAGPYCVCVFF